MKRYAVSLALLFCVLILFGAFFVTDATLINLCNFPWGQPDYCSNLGQVIADDNQPEFRASYLAYQRLDAILPATLAAFAVSLSISASKAAKLLRWSVAILGIAGALFDYAENASLDSAVAAGNGGWAPELTAAKLAFYMAALTVAFLACRQHCKR